MKMRSSFLKIGVALLFLAMMLGLSSCATNLEPITRVITEGFSDVKIDANTASIGVFPSENGECRIECEKKQGFDFVCRVAYGELKIELVDNRKWYMRIFDFGKDSLKLYLPSEIYGTLDIDASTGKIRLSEINFKDVSITSSTGNIDIKSSVLSGDFEIDVGTGDVNVADFVCNKYSWDEVVDKTLELYKKEKIKG